MRAEHHQARPPPAVHRVLRHRLLRGCAVREGVQRLEALPLVEGLLLADADHRAGVGPVGAAAQRHLVHDRGAVDEPADRADVGPGERRVVEDRGVLLLAVVQHVEQVAAVDAERLGGRVEVQPVPGLVLHLRHQDRLATQARRTADPRALGLHADDLGVGVLGDLAHQRLAVVLRHDVARLDAAVVADDAPEVLHAGLHDSRGGRWLGAGLGRDEVVAVHEAETTRGCYTRSATLQVVCNTHDPRRRSGLDKLDQPYGCKDEPMSSHEHPTSDVSVRVGWADDADAIAAVQVRAWRQEYAGVLPAGPARGPRPHGPRRRLARVARLAS